MEFTSAAESVQVSVILSTYNRARQLRNALEALAAQGRGTPAFEVIVVNNNSDDGTAELIEAFCRRSTLFRYVFEPRQGVSYAHNTGVRYARAPILAFTDDDLTVASDWVRELKCTFDLHPDIDFLGSRVLPHWPQDPPRWLTRTHWSPLALEDAAVPFYSSSETGRGVLGKCVRRDALEQVGGFIPELGRTADSIGSVEDHDLIRRLWQAGRKGMHAPNVVVYADVQPERLTKAYHRRWHTGHGKFFAMMCDEQFERTGHRWLGVPAHLYRAVITSSARCVLDAARGHQADAFEHEARLRFCVGFAWKRINQVASDARQQVVARLSVRSALAGSDA
jgi:glycosyltransferase involved in cell wall biosynthesis